jgi:2-dehydropantoate 2-reductase
VRQERERSSRPSLSRDDSEHRKLLGRPAAPAGVPASSQFVVHPYPASQPRLLIVGGGAIGGVIAAKLTRAGHDVTVLDASREHVSIMGSVGLNMSELGNVSTVVIRAVDDPEKLTGSFDYALLTLKAPFLEAGLRPLVDRNLVDTYVCLGNGLVYDRVQRITGSPELLVGTVEWGATNLGPGRVAQTTEAPIVFGAIHGHDRKHTTRLAPVLADAGDVRVSDNILNQVWSKLLLNSTFSGLGAISGKIYRDVVAEPAGARLAFALWTEGFDIAQARGVQPGQVIGIDPIDLVVRSPGDYEHAVAVLKLLMSRVGPTKASMLQDLERGAPTEVDVINGALVEHARAASVPSPLNSYVVARVHDCERGVLRPGAEAINELVSSAQIAF